MTTYNAGSAAQLSQVLASARAGDTILLAGGDYGDVRISGAVFSDAVTIRSKDAADPAIFGTLDIWNSGNLVIDGVTVDFKPDADTVSFASAVEIFYSEDITFAGSRIVGGPVAGGTVPVARAMTISDSTGVTLQNNEISEFSSGIVGVRAHDLKILSNEIHHLRTTGLRGGDFQDLVIDGNHFHSSHPQNYGFGDHANFIHPWTSDGQATPSDNITITNNFLDQGDGLPLMAIYLDDNHQGIGFRNVVIENNVILTGHLQGILLEHVDGASIANNSLLQPFGPDASPPLIVFKQDSRNAVVRDNIVSSVVSDSTSEFAATIVEKNSLALQWQDQSADNHYVNALIDPLRPVPGLESLQAVPGGIVETWGTGAALTRLDQSPTDFHGYIQSDRGEGFTLLAYPFDASHVYGPDGRVDMAGAEVVWDFGDGATGKGVVAPHQYAARGVYEVTADIRLADGGELSLGKLIHAESPVALMAGFESGFGDATGATTLKSVGAAVASVAGPDGKAADLNGGEIVYDVDGSFFSNTEYSVLFDFQKEAGSIGGKTRLFNLNGNITIILLEDQVYVAFNTDQTADWIKVGGLDIDNTDWHSLALTFSGKTGDVILYMDGDEVDRASGFKGHVQTYYSTKNLVIGDGFEGKIDNLVFLRGALSAAEVKAGVIPSGGSPLPVLEPGPAPEPEPGARSASSACAVSVSIPGRRGGGAGPDASGRPRAHRRCDRARGPCRSCRRPGDDAQDRPRRRAGQRGARGPGGWQELGQRLRGGRRARRRRPGQLADRRFGERDPARRRRRGRFPVQRRSGGRGEVGCHPRRGFR